MHSVLLSLMMRVDAVPATRWRIRLLCAELEIRSLSQRAIDCPSWSGLLLNRQFLLARLRRAFLQDSPTPGGSLRFAHRGL